MLDEGMQENQSHSFVSRTLTDFKKEASTKSFRILLLVGVVSLMYSVFGSSHSSSDANTSSRKSPKFSDFISLTVFYSSNGAKHS